MDATAAPPTIRIEIPISTPLIAPDSDAEATKRELGELAYHAACEVLAGGDEPPPDPLRPGMLAGALIGELEQALEAVTNAELPTGADRANAAATLSHLATAAEAMDRIMRRGDDDQAGPAIAPELVARAANTLGRVAQMLSGVQTARGRFTTEDQPDELTNGPWTEVRIIPDGFEDLDPQAIARTAQALAQAGGTR